jgi:hypothetical protein
LTDRAKGPVALVEPRESSYPCWWEIGMAEVYAAVGRPHRRSKGPIEVTDQKRETTAVAEHILNPVRNH